MRTKSKAVNNKAAVRRKLFLISVPFLLFITAFCYVPLLGWVISFFKYYPGIPLNKLEFVGLQNFRFFFSNGEQVLNVVKNTFVLSGLIILTLPLPAVFAILLNEIRAPKFRKLVQTFSTIPYFISYVLLYLAFVTILSPSDGMLNTLLYEKLHVIDQPLNVPVSYTHLCHQWPECAYGYGGREFCEKYSLHSYRHHHVSVIFLFLCRRKG